jgi:hypothetical protein
MGFPSSVSTMSFRFIPAESAGLPGATSETTTPEVRDNSKQFFVSLRDATIVLASYFWCEAGWHPAADWQSALQFLHSDRRIPT